MKRQKNQLFLVVSLIILMMMSGCGSIKEINQTIARPRMHIPKEAPPPKPMPKVRVALALGAGGSRGIAHLGVLEVLEKENIPIDLIVGSSAGSLIGAVYGDDPDIESVKKKMLKLKKKDLLDLSISSIFSAFVRLTGPIQGNLLEHFIVKKVKAKKFEDLQIPVVAVATSINRNKITVLRSGPIAPAVHASSALPPLFAPVPLYGETLIDGGVLSPVPVSVAREFKPQVVIAVDISNPPERTRLQNAIELLYRAMHISFYELSKAQSSKADVLIHPDLAGFGTFDDEFNEVYYQRGKEAAIEALPKIKAELNRRGIPLKKK